MSKKLKIAFLSAKRFSFYPLDYLERGLGGTETMLVLLSSALAKLGHEVKVFNCCYKPGSYSNVEWNHIWTFDPKENFDAVISLRLLEVFNDFNITSPIRGVWIHDDHLSGATQMDRAGKVNTWIAVSETQRRFIEKEEQINKDNWFVTRNAIDESIYNEALRKTKKVSGQVIYCSAHDRGLAYLLKMWPQITAKVANIQLVVTGSFALWGNTDSENDIFFKDMYALANKFDNIQLLKRVSKHDLALLQAQSELMLYPTCFDEMYCISAIECMSVGTPIISTCRSAMEERILHGVNGVLLEGSPNTEEFQEEFIVNSVDLLMNNEKRTNFAKASVQETRELSFNNLASEWESYFIKKLNKD